MGRHAQLYTVVLVWLMCKVAIESPDKLSDEDVEEVVRVWNRKGRGIVV